MKKLLLLCALASGTHAGPLPQANAEFAAHDPAEIALGQLLFYDPVLSGNRGVACATCHHPRFGTSDGVSLGLGDGGTGLGPARRANPENLPPRHVARNAPALFNLGANQFSVLFHDGRLEALQGGIRTPMGAEMVAGFDSPLAAQAMFPVLSADEMAGHYGENDISRAVSQGLITTEGGAWDIIAARVAALPEYRARFDGVIGDTPIRFTDIANAIAAFTAVEWRADNSPFDQFLRSQAPLNKAAMRGLTLFYGKAACDSCHSGQFQTDHQFHAIAMPQFGPGKAAEFENHHRDTGRMRVTGQAADAYRFRTPSLRNITLTAPYGHSGAYANLEAIIRHHLDPIIALNNYDISQAILPVLPAPTDTWVQDRPAEMHAIASANSLPAWRLTDAEVADILAFLHTLEDPVSRLGVPPSVPSGLPVPR
ncbi:MAG: c-type cytochrome [Rhodobacteraceae bacterium]|nr:c-type cytochrome [Paracoccaceae bacterium]